MMSIGYCQTWVTTSLNPSANTRTLLGADLPGRFKFLGFSLTPTLYRSLDSAESFDQFKLYDGSEASTEEFTTIVLSTGSQPGWSGQSSCFMMLDDTYLEITLGLYFEVTSDLYADPDSPFNVTLFYS